MADNFTHNFVSTPDGGQLSYYTVGTGPGILMNHGAISYALTHRQIALLLSPYYTVHIASRRGRGRSSAYPAAVTDIPCLDSDDKTSSSKPLTIDGKSTPRTYSPAFTAALLDCEVADLNLLLSATKSQYLICISSGASVTMNALLTDPNGPVAALKRIIVFEPPAVFSDRPHAFDFGQLPRFEQERGRGDLPAAMTTAMYMSHMGPTWIPRWIMVKLSAWMFEAESKATEKKNRENAEKGEEDPGVCTMAGLGGMLQFDFAIAEGMIGPAGRLAELNKLGDKLVLLAAGKSPPAYLRFGMAVLHEVVPGARYIVVPGVQHAAFCNSEQRGTPEKMVSFVRECFQ